MFVIVVEELVLVVEDGATAAAGEMAAVVLVVLLEFDLAGKDVHAYFAFVVRVNASQRVQVSGKWREVSCGKG